MMRESLHRVFGLILLLALGVLVLPGCEGERGPQGPIGPGVEQLEYTYLGEEGQACRHCHVHVVEAVAHTKHTQAFDDLDAASQMRLYCLQCHTTGFDSRVGPTDTQIAAENRGPDLYGYDDYFGLTTEVAAERRAALQGVQCESCHGPMGPNFNDHRPRLSLATGVDGDITVSLCYPCHETQLEEWLDSGHGKVRGIDLADFNDTFGRSPCTSCHTSEGFVQANDPAIASYEFDQYNFIGCPTCHDPHVGQADGGNLFQIRTLAPVEVAYAPGLSPGDPEVPRMENYGPGQTCAQCHHARRSTSDVLSQIQSGSDHFGPHSSPQMDTFIGAGCYEIPGYDYDRVAAHQGVLNGCVYCHMVRETVSHGELQDHAFHTFEPTVGNCEPCHTIPDFNFHNIQTIVGEKMDQLAGLLGFENAAAFLDPETGWNSRAAGVEIWQREAAYALVFVDSDGSRGVHNAQYVMDLLDNAIDYAERNRGLAAR
jgi:hypothetical protein